MKKLEIIRVDNYMYTLKDNENNLYIFTFEFHSMKKKPQVGDYIYLSDELLDKEYIEYSESYAFGSLDDTSGRKIEENKNTQDLIVIQQGEKKKYLKRLYG